MTIANRESWLRKWVERHGMELFSIGGQTLFAIYGMSGGLTTKYICYITLKNGTWPEGVELGRQGNPAPGVVAIEFEYNWDAEKWADHLSAMLHFGPDDKAVSA